MNEFRMRTSGQSWLAHGGGNAIHFARELHWQRLAMNLSNNTIRFLVC
jgi:hypothetical protein